MSLRARVFRGAAVLTFGQAIAQALGFARNVIIARMISPHDVGVAAALAVTLSLVELVADVSIDKLLIQADDGDDPRLQNAAQAAMAARGLIQALAVYALSWPLAALFDLREAVWAFQCVAVGPALKGLCHLDVVRLQRKLVFGPAVVREVVPQFASFAAIWPLTTWLPDFRAVLAATLLQAALLALSTHIGAERPYRWAWDRTQFQRIAVFGWPLVVNGILLFAINQGDRVAVGAAYTKEELAVWANAMLLASAPLAVFSRVASALALPVLAGCRRDREQFARRYELCMQCLGVSGAMVAIPLILSGGTIMAVVFGDAYGAAGAYAGLVAAAQAMRVCRIGPTVAALSHGETTNAALGNTARLLGVAGAALVAAFHAPLVLVAAAALAGEAVSFLVGIGRLHQQGLLRLSQSLTPMMPMCAVLGAAGCAAETFGASGSRLGAIAVAGCGSVAGLGLLLVFYGRLRSEPMLLLAGFRGGAA